MKASCQWNVTLAAIVVWSYQGIVVAQPRGEDIVIGQSIEIHSKIYNKGIRLSVALPPHYAESKEKYPVLYSVQTYFPSHCR